MVARLHFTSITMPARLMVSRLPRVSSRAPAAERFEIIHLAGPGGMGAAYLATDLSTWEAVA